MTELTYQAGKIVNRVICRTLKIAATLVPVPRPLLFSGPGAATELCNAVALQGYQRLLLVTDKVLIELCVLEQIIATLKNHNISLAIYDGVLPDPTDEQVEQGLQLLLQHQCDAVIAIGGGSPIDAGKAIAARATNVNRSLKKLSGYFKLRATPLPFFAVPTTAGTGSEATVGAVLSDPESHQKRMMIDPRLMPRMAALDSQLMQSLPPAVTAATAMDALTHAIEAYVSRNAFEESDAFARAAVQLIIRNLPRVIANSNDLKARQQLAQASHYAGLAITKASLGYVHAIAHNLGAFYNTPHGIANALVLPHVLEFSKPAIYQQLSELAVAAKLTDSATTKERAADIFIEHIRSMLRSNNIHSADIKINSADIPNIAKLAVKEATLNYPVPHFMRKKQCESILIQLSKTG